MDDIFTAPQDGKYNVTFGNGPNKFSVVSILDNSKSYTPVTTVKKGQTTCKMVGKDMNTYKVIIKDEKFIIYCKAQFLRFWHKWVQVNSFDHIDSFKDWADYVSKPDEIEMKQNSF